MVGSGEMKGSATIDREHKVASLAAGWRSRVMTDGIVDSVNSPRHAMSMAVTRSNRSAPRR